MIDFLMAAAEGAMQVAAHGGGGATQGLGGPAEMWDAIVRDFSNIGEPGALTAFFSVLMIDLVLAGDNAIVVGALAAGLPPEQRRKVILIGVIAALVLRIGFALIVTQLLAIVGLVLAGGGALLRHLDERLRRETGIPVHVADDALMCVAIGSGRSLEEIDFYRSALSSA